MPARAWISRGRIASHAPLPVAAPKGPRGSMRRRRGETASLRARKPNHPPVATPQLSAWQKYLRQRHSALTASPTAGNGRQIPREAPGIRTPADPIHHLLPPRGGRAFEGPCEEVSKPLPPASGQVSHPIRLIPEIRESSACLVYRGVRGCPLGNSLFFRGPSAPSRPGRAPRKRPSIPPADPLTDRAFRPSQTGFS